MFEERVDLSNDMTCRQMIAVGIRRLVLREGVEDEEVERCRAVELYIRRGKRLRCRAM